MIEVISAVATISSRYGSVRSRWIANRGRTSGIARGVARAPVKTLGLIRPDSVDKLIRDPPLEWMDDVLRSIFKQITPTIHGDI